ncbi:bifunctional phosphopantothenoylcysteine decarboxylase/phosphopantothenate--cysteine ligase CoaBC [Halococcoides cellulosivorans]|uniref:Coenzyme A biosynthesis bifunctional protein CoaBC n=1 Tax=Halococcoides cellulosivorans TaxID=1679096 RepID=A0A2R4WYZ4_9EURY|nr:bifunctional phosphopantothenoylcysteine decarboxylase/phosphopantothenate--cysteine ligase CoaBC [Halococcoides cellulosivorans]AWB26762.1 bifunctional phosphopantothenoylcysteine decarboxylase/phosphopantothenate--cysteine ligase CoaBC [Halococcoides cellulosivorans]
MLDGVNVVLGVTGSIAAVTTVELAHELRRRGAAVRAVTTPAATDIVHPWALDFATGQETVTEIGGAVEHVHFFGEDPWGDVFVIAPATANTVGKIAAAIDDTPVTTVATTALGAGTPVVIAPAMHRPMYDHPGVEAALDTLDAWGVDLVQPRFEEEKAKIATEDAIVAATARAAGDRPLAGQRIVVTSGATIESIDQIRTLSNRSSGRTGREVARACAVRGANVTLLHDGPDVPLVESVTVESAAEMHDAALEACADADAFVSAAAIADYTVATHDGKIPSGQSDLTLDLEPTPKVLDGVREANPGLPIVGFKLEDSADEAALIAAARDQIDRVGCAFVVANAADAAGGATTDALLVDRDDAVSIVGSKAVLGRAIAERLVEEL